MAIAMYFRPKDFTRAQYEQAMALLERAGAGRPAGRTHHSSFGSDDAVMVYDVWESQEQFDEFGKTLIPILSELGVDPGQPEVTHVINIVQ
jgi:hypothetical protein